MATNHEKVKHTLPHEVMTFVKTHYPGSVIFDIKEARDKNDNVKYYTVDLVDTDCTYHLRVDKKGRLLKEETEVGLRETKEDEIRTDENVKEPSPVDEELDEF
ncbi:MAG: hypothetical protein ACLQQ4_09000 [Bacteroidia bacterium]